MSGRQPTRRVLLLGTFDPTTARARQWRRLLERGGHDVEVHRRDVWGAERLDDARDGLTGVLARAVRLVAAELSCLRRLLLGPRPDIVVFLYPGHLDAILLAPWARLRRIPSVLDVFISLHDTVVVDRSLAPPRSLLGVVTAVADRLATTIPTRVVVDTAEHGDYFASVTGRSRGCFVEMPVGADPNVFVGRGVSPDGPVLFYGTYIPLHGVLTIVEAAAMVTTRRIRMIGSGQEYDAARRLAAQLDAPNLEFVAAVGEEELADEIASASLCLGIFGTTPKAQRVVPNKVFQCAAMGRAVITEDSPAMRAAFGDTVRTVPAGDATALAAAIDSLGPVDATRLGDAAAARFAARFGDDRLVTVLDDLLRELVGNRR